ncbi:MAG: ABC transporter permease [Thermoleophilia bacterium]
MSSETTAPSVTPGPAETAPVPALGRFAETAIRSLVPVLLALVAGGLVLLALGTNPITFYANVWSGGVDFTAWEDTIMRMAPLTLIACGLIFVFKAGIWNLGIDGQFLLAGAVIAGLAPELYGNMPDALMFFILFVVAGVVASVWTIIPAMLRAYYGVNEIITSLMTSFIGINLANILIKGPFQDAASNVPQTKAIPFTNLLPTIPGTRIHVGVIVAALAAVATWYAMSRTSFGLRLAILGANARAATHVGIPVARLIIVSFMVSGLFIGLAAASEIMGIWGYVRADWNPAFGLLVVPLVFLARFNAIAVIPFVAALALLTIGGDFATQEAGISNEFTLLLVGLVLLFMGVTELLGRNRNLGASYLQGIRRKVRVREETS